MRYAGYGWSPGRRRTMIADQTAGCTIVVQLLVSQINGCAWCDMHDRSPGATAEDEQDLFAEGRALMSLLTIL